MHIVCTQNNTLLKVIRFCKVQLCTDREISIFLGAASAKDHWGKTPIFYEAEAAILKWQNCNFRSYMDVMKRGDYAYEFAGSFTLHFLQCFHGWCSILPKKLSSVCSKLNPEKICRKRLLALSCLLAYRQQHQFPFMVHVLENFSHPSLVLGHQMLFMLSHFKKWEFHWILLGNLLVHVGVVPNYVIHGFLKNSYLWYNRQCHSIY